MAPTKRTRTQTPKAAEAAKSSKKAKTSPRSPDAVVTPKMQKKKPARLARPPPRTPKYQDTYELVGVGYSVEPVYSPNVDTDGFTEDEYDVIDGPRYYTVRKGEGIGAGRKVGGRGRGRGRGGGQEKGEGEGEGGLPSAKSATTNFTTATAATGKSARQLRAERRAEEIPVGNFSSDDDRAGLEVFADDGDLLYPPTLPRENEKDVDRFLRVIKETTKSEDPAAVNNNPFSPTEGGDDDGVASEKSFATLPGGFKPIKGVHYGAAGKFLEMMQSKGLLPQLPPYMPVAPSSSSSSSSAGDENGDQADLFGGYGNEGEDGGEAEGDVTVEVYGIDAWTSALMSTVWNDADIINGAQPGRRVRDFKGEEYENDTHEWTVHPGNKTIDRVITTHLKNIAQALNFMIRAKLSGIDISDLAAVPRRKWRSLGKAPEGAAEAVAAVLLDQSGAAICMLAERTAGLREDLTRLKIDIDGAGL